MNVKIRYQLRILTLAAVVGAVAGLSGCATSGRVDDLQAQLNALEANTSAASSEAAAANAKASEALDAANSAVNAANDANRRSMETETKIDRMFKKAMHK